MVALPIHNRFDRAQSSLIIWKSNLQEGGVDFIVLEKRVLSMQYNGQTGVHRRTEWSYLNGLE